MTATIVNTAASLLVSARDCVDESAGMDILNSAPVINKVCTLAMPFIGLC
jgi:hypothetical protein